MLKSGYCGWLELEHLHFHLGDKVSLKYRWGKNSSSKAAIPAEYLSAYVVDPDGEKTDIEVANADGEPYVSFEPEEEGYYTLVVRGEYKGLDEGINYIQNATAIVPVGHHIHGKSKSPSCELTLTADKSSGYCSGDTLEYIVNYNGEPVDADSFDFFGDSAFNNIVPEVKKTGLGKYVVTPDAGKYLASAVYTADTAAGKVKYSTTQPVLVLAKR